MKKAMIILLCLAVAFFLGSFFIITTSVDNVFIGLFVMGIGGVFALSLTISAVKLNQQQNRQKEDRIKSSDMAVWKCLWLFWLFGLLQVILTFPVFIQSIKQIVGLLYIAVKYNPAPDKDTYIAQVIYSLPFDEAWITVNGGVVKATSHSWDMVTQRYAYDFIILDETGRSFSK